MVGESQRNADQTPLLPGPPGSSSPLLLGSNLPLDVLAVLAVTEQMMLNGYRAWTLVLKLPAAEVKRKEIAEWPREVLAFHSQATTLARAAFTSLCSLFIGASAAFAVSLP